MTTIRFLTESAVADMTSLSRSTIHRKVEAREFPAPIRISVGRNAWDESEVVAWMERVRGRSGSAAEGDRKIASVAA